MKITLYTITDCEFSKQEKEYLTSHQLQFDEKNLETNKEFLTEMLAVSNNFAGTPVTKIEKDDGQIMVLKGFTKDEFDKALGFAPQEKKEEPPTGEKKPGEEMKKPEEQKVPDEVKTKPVNPPGSGEPPQVQQASNQSTNPSTTPPPPIDPLNSILQDLQSKSVAANSMPPATPPPEQPATGVIPSIPDFQGKT